ncbi:MAG: NADH:flavin oxidoreductase [Desulfobacter sp.]|nr:MAG: NADH:flavin oxidoreductase [Desulfobacter sp.]
MMNRLDDQFKIKEMAVRNRLVLAPLTTGYGTEQGEVTPGILAFYKARSLQMGIVIVEATAVSPEGRIVPGSLGLWEDSQVPGMGDLARTIQGEGAKAVIQLNHAGAKAWPLELPGNGVSPSGIACRPGIAPFEAGPQDMDRLVTAFVHAAVRAQTAGFDGVEIHGAHLYLLSQFLSPLTNLRKDKYGGGVEGRAALPLRVVTAVRDAVGADFPIFFRLNAVERVEGGQPTYDALAAGRLLAGAGVDVLDLSLAVGGTWKEEDGRRVLMTTSAYDKDQATGDVTALAGGIRSACGLPVIAVGRLNSRIDGEAALADGADMVAIGRQMICDPEAGAKILAGETADILECEACMACFASLGKGKLKCKVNRNLPD